MQQLKAFVGEDSIIIGVQESFGWEPLWGFTPSDEDPIEAIVVGVEATGLQVSRVVWDGAQDWSVFVTDPAIC